MIAFCIALLRYSIPIVFNCCIRASNTDYDYLRTEVFREIFGTKNIEISEHEKELAWLYRSPVKKNLYSVTGFHFQRHHAYKVTLSVSDSSHLAVIRFHMFYKMAVKAVHRSLVLATLIIVP
jgi:hypothetical protein